MKTHLLVLILCFCSIQMFHSQEDDGVVALSLPVRNSLTFNRFVINPTFSFVREQHKYISFFNKREWVQFDDAPLTYMASYSGRFGENIGAGLGLFQQNYGVLTTFGATTNFAYNVRMNRDSNLTFGLNIGAYKSGLNSGSVVSNIDDPALQNIPDNFLLTINPGINYGLAFIDIGLSINNLVVYNFESSQMLKDNPEQGIQAHLMYTGYMNSRGFFDEAKFSGLLRSEFKTDETIISAQAMLTIPKGIWAQVGYNSVFGMSGGLGLNITPQIAVEYNYEKAIGDLTTFGPSHDITLAYRFKNRDRYDYSSGDDVSGLISGNKRKPVISKIAKAKAEANRKLAAEKKAEEEAQKEAEAQAILLAEQKAQQKADAQAKLLAEQKAQQEAEAQAKLLAEQKAQQEAEAQAKLLAEQKAQQEAEAQTKLLAERKAQQEAEAQAKLLAEQKAQHEADA
ncbi:PorP/SprF family type IX secretion system membrane protein, partial [Psychroserpens mesophilus]